ncbi:hypothetical protein F8O01_10950 [Pseudoclavibacter chungangensis]|uniref:RsbT co-antagonist protein RsbRD N-terminal domain-containing protein n=1 Tax=Pseudoclavibacter chungangensis TaxID=587635 RepID=A0A7J5BR18_9MICO|nr:hypothetical protein [Pseudoclavibacter chungangensis]KAB1655957.1 hypothetical protein F8O01_10950 [Pseudoclavibacter chungangensis]NYJ66402.1 hypothetical protein [Pseudoclavibacter chungangensis]
MSARIVDQIVEQEHAYATSPLAADALGEIVRENVEALRHELGGGRGSLEPARRAGRMKAEAGIPVASLLHA